MKKTIELLNEVVFPSPNGDCISLIMEFIGVKEWFYDKFPSPNGDCISLMKRPSVSLIELILFPSPNGDCISLIISTSNLIAGKTTVSVP